MERKRNADSIAAGGCLSFRGRHPSGASKLQVTKADALLAKEMNSLSLEDRERVFEDIHAVPTVVKEDQEKLEASLVQMSEQLEKIKKKSAYDKAYFLCPEYVENPKFRLMFLRSENFDAKRAAVRFVTHFDRKLELFGSDKLVRNIQYDDLTPDDQASLLSGSIQFLAEKDRSGRVVCCNAQKYQDYKHWTNHIRVTWYLAMNILWEEDDLQRLGLVLVVYCIGPFQMAELDRDMMTNGVEYCGALPLRYSALHYCFNDPKLLPVISLSKLLVDMRTRLRFRSHYGSHLECQYELVAYGIPRHTLPFDEHGCLLLDRFHQQLEERRAQEENLRNSDTSVLPGKNDVLLGRGRPFQEYEGNLRLAELVDKNRMRYQTGGRGQKSVIAEELVKLVQNAGGRFLRKSEDGTWIEVADEVARDKVGHGFRTKTRRNSNNITIDVT